MNKLKTIIPIAIIAAIGGIIRKLSFIEFQVPPLVEGPRVVFVIPLPEFLHKIPFAMETANGGYGLPVTITVVTTWFLILFMFILLSAIIDKESFAVKFKETFTLLAFNNIFLANIVFSKSDNPLNFFISFSVNGSLRSKSILFLKSNTKLLPAFII